jgi:hypothetical protein
MEISFCEQCRESIPDADFDAGRAVRVGGRNFHTACAFRRSLPGRSRAVAVVLAVLAAGAAAWATVRTVRLERDLADERAARAQDADTIATLRREGPGQVDERVRAVVDGRLAGLRQETQAALDRTASTLRADAASARESVRGEVERQLAAAAEAQQDRFVAIENRLGDMADWIRDVRDLAKRTAEAAAASPPPAPATGPGGAATPPAPGASDPSPASAAPEAPERAKERAAEVDRNVALLKDSSDTVVFSAAMRLGELSDLRAVPPLVETLRTHKYYYARLAAASSLGTLRAADAMPALVDALEDKDALVQTAVAEAIHAITGEPFKNPIGRSKKDLRTLKEEWAAWWKANEALVRSRLNQPPA